jgi:hypothetical protein
MGREQIPRTWLLLSLCLLAGCVESARSADVPPDLAPRAASRPSLHVASAPKQVSPDRGAKATAPLPVLDTRAAVVSGAGQAQDATPPAAELDHFFGEADGSVREALSEGALVEVEKGRGGRSLGFKIKLEGGQVGYFKGEQVFSAANWFAEVAAFHLDRMLGLGRVPTVVSRSLPWSELEPAAGKDWRKPEIIVRDGQVKGAFVAWVSGGVRALPHKEGWERWMRVKYWPTTAVSPYQRPAVWAQELAQVKRLGPNWRSAQERARLRALSPEPDREDRPAELSDLIVFDYLIRNLDRWGGGNANVLIRGDKGPLIFLDNAAGFALGDPRPSLLESRLRALQRYRRSTIQAVRSFDRAKFEARLATEPVQPILNRAQLNDLEVRRKALLAWVAEQERTYGEAIWAWE